MLLTVAVAIATVIIVWLYWYGTSTHDYFVKRGIPGPKPLPFVGNLWEMWKQVIVDVDMENVKKYGKFFGVYDGLVPNLFTTDAEFIRQVYLKDFDKFQNRRTFGMQAKYLRVFITILRGKEWKNVRSSISPIFTTGKIRRMSPLIVECAQKVVRNFEKNLENGVNKIDLKKNFNGLTMNVIARCVFGLNIEGIEDGNDEFTKNAAPLFNPPANKSPVILIPFVFPFLTKIGLEKAFMTKELKFFIRTAEEMVAERKNRTRGANDFISVALESLRELQRDDNPSVPALSEEQIEEIVIAQAVVFILAGFDTTATTLSLSCYLLATHADIQEKVYAEVAEKLEQYGEVNYDMVNDLPYMDQFINEVLRLYPPAMRTERECNEDFSFNGVSVQKGTVVSVPVYALHHSEEYYPDPEKFDPDRFSAENKSSRSPYCYMPFGTGPRNCVGMRFALEEVKITLSSLVTKFRFVPVEETPEKLVHDHGFVPIFQVRDTLVGIEAR